MLGECCRLCLDVVHLLKSKRKVLNKGLILNYLPLLVSAHLPYMSWIRICISPYGSGSDFYYTNPDPQIRIRITDVGSATFTVSSKVPEPNCKQFSQHLSLDSEVFQRTRGLLYIYKNLKIHHLPSLQLRNNNFPFHKTGLLCNPKFQI